MTRDEAIKMVFAVLLSSPTGSSASHGGMTDQAVNLVDSLAALGLLRLEDRLCLGVRLTTKEAECTVAPKRCEPPPEHQDKEWHWLKQIKSRSVQPIVCRWLEVSWYYCGEVVTADDGYDSGWRYIAPCEPPTPSVTIFDYGLPRTA